jgi:hypothetical protein
MMPRYLFACAQSNGAAPTSGKRARRLLIHNAMVVDGNSVENFR